MSNAMFMVGEQRSGSNLLRVMLGQADEIAAPHPPHILERMTPLLPIYGDLDQRDNFVSLVDDVCRLVERNPVPWDNITRFDRDDVIHRCRDHSLIAVFGAVMDIYAEAHGKAKWLCKSMTYIKYAKELDAYFGAPKYIHLYRDGRDVVLSFIQAVVGDKHPYAIARKWAELQRLCLNKKLFSPEQIYSVCYEKLTTEPEPVLRDLCHFLDIQFRPEMLSSYLSDEAERTARASSLWSNLSKPIMQHNSKKFLQGLSEEDIRLIESVAGDCLDALEYDRVLVPRGEEANFEAADIERFEAENRLLIQQCQSVIDPEDRRRRHYQLQVLEEIKSRAPDKSINAA